MTTHPDGHTVTGAPTGSAAHAARPTTPLRRLVVTVAVSAGVVGLLGVGMWAYSGSTGPATSTPTSAQLITVSATTRP